MSESSKNLADSGRDGARSSLRRKGIVSGIATLIWRIFLLGVGGAVAFGVGVAWAIQNPEIVTEKPLAANVWERLQKQRTATDTTEKMKVTLPSDFLFTDIESTLSLEAKEILDEYVVTDLQPYEGKTIHIAAYTDVGEDTQLNQELSFRRAKVIENYLSEALEGEYRWVTVGYGKSNGVDVDEGFLNRRIEIAVD